MKRLSIACCGFLAAGSTFAAVVGPAAGTTVDGVQAAAVLEVNPTGIGHVNLVPYFSTRSGFDTYVNVVNTDTRNGKAVKVRFRSAVNGEDIGNFTVLLGPGDTWAAALTRDTPSGYSRLVHNDKSCTLPSGVAVTLGPTYVIGSSGQTADASRTQEGSVEIITMADIPRLDPEGRSSALFNAITAAEGASIPACSASALSPLGQDSTNYADARNKGLAVPTSGTMTEWTLINVPRALSYTGRATALEARASMGGAPAYGNVVLFPQTSTMVADPARTVAYTTNPNIRGIPPATAPGYVESQLPDLSTPYFASGLTLFAGGVAPRLQASAVNRALSAGSFGSQFVTEASVLAKTDWVVTLPSRYMQVGYTPPGPMGTFGGGTVIDLTTSDSGVPIGSGSGNSFGVSNVATATSYDPVCIKSIDPFILGTPTAQPQNETTWRTREGVAISMTPETRNGAALPFELCGHSVILRFVQPGNDPSDAGALGDARNRRRLISSANAGWGRIQTPGLGGAGLPIIGFAASELFNAAVAPGVAGVFGLTFPLTTTKPAP